MNSPQVASVIVETPARSLAKAASRRLVGSLVTAAIVFAITGRAGLALVVGAVDAGAKLLFHVLHDRVWNRIGFGRRRMEPGVLWFTGLSGSGKTTLARRVVAELEKRGVKTEYLDGDTVRDLFPSTGFSKPERDAHVRRIGHLASSLEKHGVFVVAAFISPYAESRAFVRRLCRQFVEIHVATPLEICEQRDVKGLYAKARRGEIRNYTGIDDPYESPVNPELAIDTTGRTEEACAAEITDYLEQRFLGRVA